MTFVQIDNTYVNPKMIESVEELEKGMKITMISGQVFLVNVNRVELFRLTSATLHGVWSKLVEE